MCALQSSASATSLLEMLVFAPESLHLQGSNRYQLVRNLTELISAMLNILTTRRYSMDCSASITNAKAFRPEKKNRAEVKYFRNLQERNRLSIPLR